MMTRTYLHARNEVLQTSTRIHTVLAGHLRLLSLALITLSFFASLAASAQPTPPALPTRQAALAALTSQLHVGTEFFLNRTETKESIDKHFLQMHDNGLTLVRIFIIWDDIEHSAGHWDFTKYDWIYDAAAKNNIKIAATLCSEDPPGWKRRTPFYHHYTNLDIPEFKADAEVYLDKVVNHYKAHPAQSVWLLMNEPQKYDTDADTFLAFGDWLQKKYGSIDELNRNWFQQLDRFNQAKIDDHLLNDYWADPQQYLDWKNFNGDHLINILIWIRQKVLAIDPNHPTHFNLTQPTGDAYGQDAWNEKQVPDMLGVSMHTASAVPSTTPSSEFGERFAYRLAIIASASSGEPSKPFWVTELESGPTVYTGHYALTVTPQDLTRWMWDSFGAGSNAVIFWLWHPRDYGTESGEWGLVSADGTPSVRLPAVRAVTDGLRRNPNLALAHPQSASVAILYNRESILLNDFDGRKQGRKDDVTNALFGCYLALLRAHIPTQFVDIDQLKSGAVKQYPILYAPDSYALDDQGVAALKDYVQQGGTLWADGLTTWKKENSQTRPTIPGGLTDLFGVAATDIYSTQAGASYSVTDHDEQGGELWRLPLQLKGADVIMRDKDNNPFAVKHAFGKGQAYYFGSAVTIAYARRSNPIVQQWIVGPALAQQSRMPVQLNAGSDHVIFRGLTGPSNQYAILSNWGATESVTVSFDGIRKVTDALTGSNLPVHSENSRTMVTLPLNTGSSMVLEAR